MVEVRDYAAYVHGSQIKGAGGIPVGTGGKAMLLISGGIDSPVAGYMMAKRGLEISAIHFCISSVYIGACKTESNRFGAQDVLLLRQNQDVHRAIHRNSGSNP